MVCTSSQFRVPASRFLRGAGSESILADDRQASVSAEGAVRSSDPAPTSAAPHQECLRRIREPQHVDPEDWPGLMNRTKGSDQTQSSREYLRGLGDDVDVTYFPRPARQLAVAKWWFKPVCWLLRTPTRRYV